MLRRDFRCHQLTDICLRFLQTIYRLTFCQQSILRNYSVTDRIGSPADKTSARFVICHGSLNDASFLPNQNTVTRYQVLNLQISAWREARHGTCYATTRLIVFRQSVNLRTRCGRSNCAATDQDDCAAHQLKTAQSVQGDEHDVEIEEKTERLFDGHDHFVGRRRGWLCAETFHAGARCPARREGA